MGQTSSRQTGPRQGSAVRSNLGRATALLAALALLIVTPVWSQQINYAENPAPRSFDARDHLQANVKHAPSAAQLDALDRLERQAPGLTVRFDHTTGATRTLSHPTRALSTEIHGGSPRDAALTFIESNLTALGLAAEDVEERILTDEVPSSVTGATHFYFNQALNGIPVYNAQLQVNVNRRGQVYSVNNQFLPGLAGAVNTLRATKGAEQAVAAAARELGIDLQGTPAVVSRGNDVRQTTVVDPAGISLEPIEAQLAILPINKGTARLVWNFQIQTLDEDHWFDMNVDAVSGKVWTRFDWVADANYRVFPRPVESPNHGSRALLTDPQDATASPLGWHDTGSSSFTITQGNNVHAYEDRDANNFPPSSEVNCGSSLNCDFPLDLSQPPSAYIPAAVTNLFYWNNTIHDIQYNFGFDEAAGNFQENNFGNGGSGSDSVNAEAQDGSGTNNANFATPPDGSNPRMQMFIWTAPNPDKDGDLDNGIIIHEYGHGISIRQVGGPSNSSCLNNTQQPGEGWSDWFALAYTAETGDAGTDRRGIGTYALDEPTTGDGIRVLPYSTDNAINNWTYESIGSMSVPHGVGSVWAQAIWEVYWTLVAKHGFDEDLGNRNDAAGNHRAMLYVNEGLKNTACSPDFLDTRDGIIQAANNLFGGEDVCDIWQAFADFGLGVDASTGGPNTQSATNGFSLPAECGGGGGTDPDPGTCPAGSIDFNSLSLTSYSGQNVSNNVSVANGGDTLHLQDNTWVRSTSTFNVTSDTVVEFLYQSDQQGEIHAIGFDENDTLNDNPRHFQIWGTQNWTGTGNVGRTSQQYTGSGNFESFSIPVGQTYTGSSMFLVFTNDNDAGSGNNGRFACVRVFEDTGGGGGDPVVLHDEDFDDGSAQGYTKTSGSTDLWRLASDCVTPASGTLSLAFSRSSPNCDYDVGTAVGTVTGPVIDASAHSTCTWSFNHFWQTESFNGDFDRMFIEVSTNGGSTWSTLQEINARDANPGGFQSESFGVSCSSQLRFRYRFDSEDGVSNDFLGWYIDDVQVIGQ